MESLVQDSRRECSAIIPRLVELTDVVGSPVSTSAGVDCDSSCAIATKTENVSMIDGREFEGKII